MKIACIWKLPAPQWADAEWYWAPQSVVPQDPAPNEPAGPYKTLDEALDNAKDFFNEENILVSFSRPERCAPFRRERQFKQHEVAVCHVLTVRTTWAFDIEGARAKFDTDDYSEDYHEVEDVLRVLKSTITEDV